MALRSAVASAAVSRKAGRRRHRLGAFALRQDRIRSRGSCRAKSLRGSVRRKESPSGDSFRAEEPPSASRTPRRKAARLVASPPSGYGRRGGRGAARATFTASTQIARSSRSRCLDGTRPCPYSRDCTEYGASKVDGSPRGSRRQLEVSRKAGRGRHRLGAFSLSAEVNERGGAGGGLSWRDATAARSRLLDHLRRRDALHSADAARPGLRG